MTQSASAVTMKLSGNISDAYKSIELQRLLMEFQNDLLGMNEDVHLEILPSKLTKTVAKDGTFVINLNVQLTIANPDAEMA